MDKTIFGVCDAARSGMLPWLGVVDYKFTKAFVRFVRAMSKHVWKDDYRNTGYQFYRDHIETVKRTIPSGQLLELKLEDGIEWKPICDFLDLPIPAEPYPRGNEPTAFKTIVDGNIQDGLKKSVMESLVYVTPLLCLGFWFLFF
jgi:hypothetical protein